LAIHIEPTLPKLLLIHAKSLTILLLKSPKHVAILLSHIILLLHTLNAHLLLLRELLILVLAHWIPIHEGHVRHESFLLLLLLHVHIIRLVLTHHSLTALCVANSTAPNLVQVVIE